MTATDATKLAAAVALVGQPRGICNVCGQPSGVKSYGGAVHTARSAARAFGLDPQVVYRAMRKLAATG